MSQNQVVKYSVVVATYNRAELLKKCLESLTVQTIPKNNYEIIIINDGSDDTTDGVLESFSKSHANINFIHKKQENAGPAKARNLGIKHSSGKIIFFTDDDCVVPQDWIETLASAYDRHPEIAGAGGWYKYPAELERSFFKRSYIAYTMTRVRLNKFYGETLWTQEIKNNLFLTNPSGNTSNMSYKKEILIRVGGFDEALNFVGLIDWELKKRIMKLHYNLLHIPYPVLHLKPLNLYEITRKFFNRGRGFCHLSLKNPSLFRYYYPVLRELKIRFERTPKAHFTTSFILFSIYEYALLKIGWQYQHYFKEKHQ